MKVEDKKSIIADVAAKKRELLVMRVKRSSGDSAPVNKAKEIRKDIARLLTKLNSVK